MNKITGLVVIALCLLYLSHRMLFMNDMSRLESILSKCALCLGLLVCLSLDRRHSGLGKE